MRRKKNLIPTLVLALLSWSALGYFIYAFSPHTSLPLLPLDPKIVFSLVVFLALFFSFTLLFQNTRRGFLVGLGLTTLIILRFFQFFHPLYIVLIVALLLTTELYFASEKTRSSERR